MIKQAFTYKITKDPRRREIQTLHCKLEVSAGGDPENQLNDPARNARLRLSSE